MSDVKIWEEDLVIPTYEPGLPDKNPMFIEKRVYQGSSGRIYPYPNTEEISFTKTDKVWHAVWLENEYLKVCVLPELGGRIQRALDKTNNYDFVYYNHVIKPALVGLTGPWISGGIEFNWPQHHRPTTFLPVDHVTETHEDGSVTLLCNDIDQMYGTKGIMSFTLYPGKAFIEIRGQLYNRTNLPQTFLWWANPAVPVNDNTQSIFPADVHFVMDHGKRDVSRFPIARGVYYKHDYSEGVDISRYRNIPVPTSYMAEKSAYDFVGGYDYGVGAGLLHVADHHISPGKKQWTWGCGDFGRAWDRNLTDEDGPYIELMCGVYTDNQPDFTWLKPFEEKTFVQYFMPYKGVGQVRNATVDAAVNLTCTPLSAGDLSNPDGAGTRANPGDSGNPGNPAASGAPGNPGNPADPGNLGRWQVHIVVYASARHEHATVELSSPQGVIVSRACALSPTEVFEETFEVTCAREEDLKVTVRDGERELVSYQKLEEGIPEQAQSAPAAKAPEEILTNEELLLTGEHLEQYRHATLLPDPYYLEALKRDPGDMRVNNAYGLLLLRRGAFAQAEPYFRASIRRATMMTPNPYSSEAMYNLGVCLLYLGREDEAYDQFYKATWSNEMQEMSFYYLAAITARREQWAQALAFADKGLVKNAHNIKLRALRAAILLHLGRRDEAESYIEENLRVDPFDYVSRFLGAKAFGRADRMAEMQQLMRGFVGNYLAAARDLMEAGLYKRAICLLGLYEGTHPLVTYYMGYAQKQLDNKSNIDDRRCDNKASTAIDMYRAGEAAPSDYCFPNKLEDIAVLRDVIETLGAAQGEARQAAQGEAQQAAQGDARQAAQGEAQQAAQGEAPCRAPRAAYYLGCLYYDKLQYEEAARLWEQSAAADPSFPTVHRNLALAYYNKLGRAQDALTEMTQAHNLNPADARVLLEFDQLRKKLGATAQERLELLDAEKETVLKRDDLLVEYITLLNTCGRYSEALDLIAGHSFRPWEGGEGKVPAQNKAALLQLAVRDLKNGDAGAAEEKLERALIYPESFGEGRLEGTKDNHIHYFLGVARARLGKTAEARSAFDMATLGADEPAGAMYYYDQPADMILFKGLALRALGEERKACACFNKLMDYGEKHVRDEVTYDYFAVSLPDFMIFDADLPRSNQAHCWYLMGLSHIGSGESEEAARCFKQAQTYDRCHQMSILYERMVQEGLFA